MIEMTMQEKVDLFNQRVDAWLGLLRDPSRKQTTGRLIDADGAQCCLGVLCDVAELQKFTNPDSRSGPGYIGPVRGDTYRTNPPTCVANSVGISEAGNLRYGEWKFPEGMEINWGRIGPSIRNLTSMNDTLKLSFSQIADVIEHNREAMLRGVMGDQDGDGQPG